MGNPKRIFIVTDAKKITEILLRQDGKKAQNWFDKFEKSKTTALTGWKKAKKPLWQVWKWRQKKSKTKSEIKMWKYILIMRNIMKSAG